MTGLGNRRALLAELDAELADAPATDSAVLVMFDLDGFKDYNDTFGHPAGDALLVRLGGRLEQAVAGCGSAYRLGGDEFCALLRLDPDRVGDDVDRAVAALHERGEGFEVSSSHGTVILPAEAGDSARALQLADQRLYAQKGVRRRQATTQQVRDVLLQMVTERTPELRDHIDDVALLAQGVGRRLGLRAHELHDVVRAAELHDIGKMAIPDALLRSRVRWTRRSGSSCASTRSSESGCSTWRRRSRASRSWSAGATSAWTAGATPTGLAGDEIPLGARIIAVCDAFDAMTSDRPYRRAVSADEAVAELLRHAGTQFDPDVIAAFQAELAAPSRERPAILQAARSDDRALSVSAN